MNASSRAISATLAKIGSEVDQVRSEAEQLRDIRVHWHEWRQQWEKNLAANGLHHLRGVADLQTGFSHRANIMK